MKQKLTVIFLILMCFAVFFAVNVQAETTITTDATGTHCGYNYELWKDGTGITSMTLNDGGGFSCMWSSINNVMFRYGKRFYSNETHQQIGNITMDYACNFQPNGNSYLGVHGWTKNPTVEYYIVESWGTFKPPGSFTPKGRINIDGATYDIYNITPYNTVSILPKPYRYMSVRTSKRTSGTVSVSEHFKAWESLGMELGSMYEVMLLVEGYQSSGKADVTSMSLNIGKPQPTATPAKSIEDLNGDGAINMLDIMLLASAFNTVKGSAGYNEKYDLDKNGAINMADVIIVAAKFNQLVAYKGSKGDGSLASFVAEKTARIILWALYM